MFNLLHKIGAIVGSGLIFLGSILNPVPQQNIQPIQFGSFFPVQAQRFTLAGGGISLTDVTMVLTTFKLPDASTTLTMSNFGSIGYGTIEPGTSKEEQISFTGVTQNGNGSATLTGINRGVGFVYPYATSSANIKTHAGGSTFVLSNTAAFYSQFANLSTTGTISAVWSFTSSSIPLFTSAPTFVNSLGFVDKAYVDAVATSGAPDALVGTKGLVDLSDQNQFSIGSSTGKTTARLVPPNSYFNATSSATSTGVVTMPNGLISPTFISTSSVYNWTGQNTYTATNTFSGALIASSSFNTLATSTFTGNITINPATSTFGNNNAVTKSYNDLTNILVTSTTLSMSANVSYKATSTPGFVVAYGHSTAGGSVTNLFGYNGSASSTSEVVQDNNGAAGTTGYMTVMFYVPENWFFKVSIDNSGSLDSAIFYPLVLTGH